MEDFVAGNIAGIIGITLVYPLDTAKMRLQVSNKYNSTFDVLSSMIKKNGVGSMYRGLASPASGFGLTFAVSFSSYGNGCRMIKEYRGQSSSSRLSYSDMALAGGYTGFVQSPIRQVVERVKSVMQVREAAGGRSPYSWSGACAVDLVRKEGWRGGLFQGMSSVYMREIPQFAMYYPAYALAKDTYSQYLSNDTLVQFLAGGTAGIAQWLPPFYSLDVIKSRMQTAPQGTYTGIWDCVTRLYREEGGARVFVRGLSPAMVRAFPLHAIIFVTFEFVKGLMNGEKTILGAVTTTAKRSPVLATAAAVSTTSLVGSSSSRSGGGTK